ncbi:hypothetical protein I3760_01G155100 [Carya illinoinensis]|nr:hypothetical protein I3760_01G155100 [Carya illinoinensis]
MTLSLIENHGEEPTTQLVSFFSDKPRRISRFTFDIQIDGKGYEDAKPIIAALKSKGASAIGAAGFCWGGKVAVKLASSTDIKAAVLLHPSRVTEDDINDVKVPIAILGAEKDHFSPPEQLKHFGEKLSVKSEFDSFVKIFPCVAHGWTVMYKVEDESAVRGAEEAHLDMLNYQVC